MTFPTPEPAIAPGTDLVGKGWPFPAVVSAQGGIALVGQSDEIASSMRMILGTAMGERVMRPEFGCAIWDLLFEPINSTILGRMRVAVEEALERWEPRVDIELVNPIPADTDAGEVKIDIEYRIRATNSRRNLVYPFYIIPEE